MDMAKRLFGYEPALCNRGGAIGTAILNVSDLAQNVDMGVTFNIAYKLDVISSSAADAAAGTGARTIEIYGMDYDGNPLTEIVTMNGQTAVQTANTFWRVFAGKVQTAGTGRKNAGDIYIYKTGTGGTITAGVPGTLTSALLKVLTGFNFATSGMWTCPLGMTYSLENLVAQARVIAGRIMVFHSDERSATPILAYPAISVDVAVSGAAIIPVHGALVVNELQDIYFKAQMTAASGIVAVDACLRQINPSSARY